MMKKTQIITLIIALMSLVSGPVMAGGDDDGEVTFKIKNMGMYVNGEFEIVKTNITYDEDNPSESLFIGVIKVESINTGIDKRDRHLRNEDYFEVETYPYIKFKSTSVKKKDKNTLTVKGDLTIKDVTKTVTLEVDVQKSGDKHIFTTSLEIDRLDYNVGSSSMVTGDEVFIDIKATH